MVDSKQGLPSLTWGVHRGFKSFHDFANSWWFWWILAISSGISPNLCFFFISSLCLKYCLLYSQICFECLFSKSLINYCSISSTISLSRGSAHIASRLAEPGSCSSSILSNFLFISSVFFYILEFQWFLIELSVLASMTLAISAHLFPNLRCSKYRIHSSSWLQLSFLIFGFRWLCHLSQHCFPILPGRFSAIEVHF